jgi:hypothetical protein
LISALEAIRADDTLKERTIALTRSGIADRARTGGREPKSRAPRVKAAAVRAACIAMLFACVCFGVNIYYVEASYISMDANPSIGLIINRFDRVIGDAAYNDDGATLLSVLRLRHKTTAEAIEMLVDSIIDEGYLSGGGDLVYVAVQTSDPSLEAASLSAVDSTLRSVLSGRGAAAGSSVISVDAPTRREALEYGVTPAKYLAILALQSVDPSVTIEHCRDHSIDEINGLTLEHGGHGASASSDGETYADECDDESSSDHHGGGHDGGRHR